MKKALILLFAGILASGLYSRANAAPLAPYTVDANTVALYHFEGNTNDGVGNHNGTLNGDAQYGSGYFGQGLALDGSGDYVRLGNVHQNPEKSLANGTVEAMVNLSAAPNYFVMLGSGNEYGYTWDDGFFLGRHASYGNNLMFGIWGGGWNYAISKIDPASLIGDWHHIAGSWGTEGVQLWLDGELVATNPYTGSPNPAYSTALIGTDSWTWATPGTIDEVRISDIQRTFSPTPAPEPASMMLGLMGLGSLIGFRKKQAV